MTHLEIVPYVGDSPVPTDPDQIEVRINPEYKELALKLAKEASRVKPVIANPKDLESVNDVQGRIQAALNQIEAVRKSAKAPVLALEHAIDGAASGVADDLKAQKERLAGILNNYTTTEKQKREAAIREVHENKRREEERINAQLVKAQEELQKAQLQARNAESLEDAATARVKVEELREKAVDLQFDLTMTKQAPVIEPVFKGPIVRGATTTEKVTVVLVDLEKFLQNAPTELIVRLANIELKNRVTIDYVDTVKRTQIRNPDYNEAEEFDKIGILVNRGLSTHVRSSAKVVS